MALKNKMFLVVYTLINTILSHAEMVSYVCVVEDAPFQILELSFERHEDWLAAWDWEGDPDTQITPSFVAEAVLATPDMEFMGVVEGQFESALSGRTGFAYLSINAAMAEGKLNLLLMEDLRYKTLRGSGKYLEEYLSLNCYAEDEV